MRAKILLCVIRSTLFLAVLLNLALLAQIGEVGAAPPPPLSTMPDILNGERYVLPVDDVLVAQTFKGYNDGYAARYVDLGLTSNSAISSLLGTKLHSNELASYGNVGPELVATGRLFLSNTDVGLTFTLSDSGGLHLETTLLTKSGTALSEVLQKTIPMTAALQPRAVVVADFTGDGLAEVVFHAGSTEADGSRTIIGTAVDTSEPTSGLLFGPEYVGGPACLDMKAADLDGDGRSEIICLYHYAQALWIVVHTVDPTTRQILDPPGNRYHYLVAPYNAGDFVRLAVGKFDDDMTDAEIAVVHGNGAGGGACPGGIYCSVSVTPFKVSIAPPPPTGTGAVSFAQGLTTDIGPYLNGSTGVNWKYLVGLEVATGKLDWFGGNPRDQIVIAAGMSSDSHYKGYAAVVVNFTTRTDPTTKVTNTMYISTDQLKASAYNNTAASMTCLNGVAVGRFSPPPPTDSTGNPDPMGIPKNSQVALLLGALGSFPAGYYSQRTDCGPDVWDTTGLAAYTHLYEGMSLGIYTVDPANNYKITLASSTTLPIGGHEYNGITFAPPRLAVGDFQGRSLRLGEPSIITVANQIQPQFVIGAPPMHLDFFIPPHDTSDRAGCYAPSAKDWEKEPMSGTGSGMTAACIQNVSAYPGQQTGGAKAACDYCATFSTSTDATLAGHQETTTSTSWSNEGGGSASFTFGTLTPKLVRTGGFQVELHGSAKKMHTNSNTSQYETQAGHTISLDMSTGTDDMVLYTTQDIYLYFYPVIGQTDDDGNPIYLHFSVPDKTDFATAAPASDLAWYQPPHEVGNIFSYPGNKDQLMNEYPGAAESGCPPGQTCDSDAQAWLSTATATPAIKWTKSQSESQTAGSVDKTEWNIGTSMTGVYKAWPGLFGYTETSKINAYYDHNGSTVNQYTNTNKKTLAASNGFSVTSTPMSYSDSTYRVTARILGSVTPSLDSGYWDQPVPMPKPDGTAGEGFVPAVTLDGPMQVAYSTDMNGGDFTAGTLWRAVYGRLPDIALQHHKRWHWVKRDSAVRLSDVWYFVPLYSDATLDNLYMQDNLKMKGFFINPATAAESQGPQMTVAREGEQLRLAARIYNYSLVGLPAGANVKVRFYAQILNPDEADPPHYDLWAPDGCTLIGEYSIAGTKIGGFRTDTDTKVANNWAMAHTTFDTTDRGGQHLIFWVVAWAENADGTLVAELEQHGMTSRPPEGCPANSILDMPMEFYSNNVGFYEQPFFIMPKALAAAPMPTGQPLQPFSIGALKVSPVHVWLPYAGELWELEVPLQAGDQDAFSVHLVHAGQGPGGRVSNTGLIPYIEAGQTYADRLTFRPLWCGPHSALVKARPAFRDPVSATLEFEIACRPEDVTAFFNDVLTNASLAGIVSVNKNGQVQGRLAALQNAVYTAERLAKAGAITGACKQYSQAIERVADAGNGPVAQLLEDIITNAREKLGCR